MSQPKPWAQDALIPPEPDGHFAMIPLTQGKFAIVDETEAERVLGMGGWYATWGYCTWYAARYDGRGRPRIYMHTLIAGFKEPDHVNLGGEDTRPAFTRLYRLCLYPSLP